MTIALDVTGALVGNTGVARCAVALPAAIEALGVPVLRFAVSRNPLDRSTSGVRHVPVPRRIMAQAWRSGHPLLETLVRVPVELVHSLDLLPPPTRAPRVMTVHDLGALERPDLHAPASLAAAQAQLAAALGADAVCAVSAATAAVLVAHGVPASAVTVTPNGLTALPAADGPALRAPGYLIAVGMLTPRKGFDVLVRALEQPPLAGLRLLLVGPDGYRAAELHAQIDASPAAGRIERLGFVADADLAVLLRDAACQVVPSRIEGFGLPVLEAMSRGLPVVCADIPALREVGGRAPFFAAAEGAESLADAVTAALAAPPGRLAAGRTDAAAWTWERAARATVGAYERVLGSALLP